MHFFFLLTLLPLVAFSTPSGRSRHPVVGSSHRAQTTTKKPLPTEALAVEPETSDPSAAPEAPVPEYEPAAPETTDAPTTTESVETPAPTQAPEEKTSEAPTTTEAAPDVTETSATTVQAETEDTSSELTEKPTTTVETETEKPSESPTTTEAVPEVTETPATTATEAKTEDTTEVATTEASTAVPETEASSTAASEPKKTNEADTFSGSSSSESDEFGDEPKGPIVVRMKVEAKLIETGAQAIVDDELIVRFGLQATWMVEGVKHRAYLVKITNKSDKEVCGITFANNGKTTDIWNMAVTKNRSLSTRNLHLKPGKMVAQFGYVSTKRSVPTILSVTYC